MDIAVTVVVLGVLVALVEMTCARMGRRRRSRKAGPDVLAAAGLAHEDTALPGASRDGPHPAEPGVHLGRHDGGGSGVQPGVHLGGHGSGAANGGWSGDLGGGGHPG